MNHENHSVPVGDLVRRGNIYRTGGQYDLPLYLGSGEFGGCFDSFGAQPHPFRQAPTGNTSLMHADFYHRGKYGLDYFMPVGRLVWDDTAPLAPRSQAQDLYDGTLLTVLGCAGGTLRQTIFFRPDLPDTLAVRFAWDGCTPPAYSLVCDASYRIHYNLPAEQRFSADGISPAKILLSDEAGTARVNVLLRVIGQNARLSFGGGKASLTFDAARGEVLLLLSVASSARADGVFAAADGINDIDAFRKEAVAAWHMRWGSQIPDLSSKPWNKLFLRGVYQLLASFGTSRDAIAPPNGWSANGWPFHFPGDFSYIFPTLLKLGYTDIAKAKVEFFFDRIPDIREATKRIYGLDGVQWPHVIGTGRGAKILDGEEPNYCFYHSCEGVFPPLIAEMTADALGDADWTRRVAMPVILGAAEFYANALWFEDGTWNIRIIPSTPMDEFGGRNEKNYLDALYAARSVFEIALRMAKKYRYDGSRELLAKCEKILKDGLTFGRLENTEYGIYQPCEGDGFDLGKVKHPAQLSPYGLMPLDGKRNEWEENAYRMRYRLCDGSDRNFFHGWTLAFLLLCEANHGDTEAFRENFRRVHLASYTDEEEIQIFETSAPEWFATPRACKPFPYYVTSIGMIANAILTVENTNKNEKEIPL